MATNQEQTANVINAETNQMNRNNSTKIPFVATSKRNVCRILSIYLICNSITRFTACSWLVAIKVDS